MKSSLLRLLHFHQRSCGDFEMFFTKTVSEAQWVMFSLHISYTITQSITQLIVLPFSYFPYIHTQLYFIYTVFIQFTIRSPQKLLLSWSWENSNIYLISPQSYNAFLPEWTEELLCNSILLCIRYHSIYHANNDESTKECAA